MHILLFLKVSTLALGQGGKCSLIILNFYSLSHKKYKVIYCLRRVLVWLWDFILLVLRWNLQQAESIIKDFLTRCKTSKCNFHFYLHFFHSMCARLQNKMPKGKYHKIQNW